MTGRVLNARERYLLSTYQHLMTPADRMVAQALVGVDFAVEQIPKSVWRRVWIDLPGIDSRNRWKVPVQICLRLLQNHRSEIKGALDGI